MDLFRIIAVVITLAALFSYVNHRTIKLPQTIGVMIIALATSLGLIALHRFGVDLDEQAAAMLLTIDFNQLVLGGMLAFLLFAGALHVDINDLAEEKWAITLLATFGVLTSTAIVGVLTFALQWILGLNIPFLYCLVFGALISPTDPIAVLGILKSVGAPKRLETKITGESLFNDGIGVVVFLALLELARGTDAPSALEIGTLFAQEALGGAVLGLTAGLVAYFMLRSVDSYQVETLGTLSLVMGTYAAAGWLHLSGPIAVVIAGLLIGNHGRRLAMSDETRERLDAFWELLDEILNAVLFVLLGLEVLVVPFSPANVTAGVIAIPIVLLARLASVAAPVKLLGLRREFDPHTVRILTWAGLRGGISVALALALPRGPVREVLLVATYCVVLFSIIVQGLTIGWVIRRAGGAAAPEADPQTSFGELLPEDDRWTM